MQHQEIKSSIETIEELCDICERQAEIIKRQASALEQLGAVIAEDDKERHDG